MKNSLLFFCLLNTLTMYAQQNQYLHDNWQFRQTDSTEWRAAVVPGSVHTDLIREGLIPDPFFNTHEKDVQWIENEDWEYRSSFSCTENILNEDHITLVFEGLDTYAEVWLNDSLILSANNMHRAWETDVKSVLKPNNELRILFRSPVEMGKELSKAIPFKMPVDERIYTRKAQYQYGWDWGPRLVGCGIWKAVYLRGWSEARIENIQILQDTLTDEFANLNLQLRWQAQPGEQYTVEWQVEGEPEAQTILQVHSGQATPPLLSLPFQINNPKRWWSNGLGDAHLYTGVLRILKDSVVVDRQTLRFGLRTIELVQEPDEQGKSFYFRLNGQPVFAKGANFIPTHSFPEQTTAESYRHQLQEAADAGVNMLRIWGGGIYEADIFYDLCDSLGIMVWQDFMFACAMYPGDSAFLDNVMAEITYQTERLRNHPSIVLWCGNNEIDEAWHNWGWQVLFGYLQLQADQIWDWYEELFHRRIPAQLAISDPSRSYWPSSPSIGWGRKEAMNQGDMHYWGVWWGKFPFRVYENKVGRFMSEYGFQAMPSRFTFDHYIDSSEQYLRSPALMQHQKHPVGYETIDDYMKRDFPVPVDFDDYVYTSQLLQAWGIQTALLAHLRNMPYCMGSLYWQWNDCWPVTSWSATDHDGRRKALYYTTRRTFGDYVMSAEDSNGRFNLYLVQHVPSDSLRLRLFHIDYAEKMVTETIDIAATYIPDSRIVYTDSLHLHKKSKAIYAVLENLKGEVLYSDLITWKSPLDMKLKPSQVDWRYNEADSSITLVSDHLSWGVYLYHDDDELRLSDNYFMLAPGVEKTIYLESVPANFPEGINIMVLNNLTKKK